MKRKRKDTKGKSLDQAAEKKSHRNLRKTTEKKVGSEKKNREWKQSEEDE